MENIREVTAASQSTFLQRLPHNHQFLCELRVTCDDVNNSGRLQAITARQELLDSESGKGQVSRGPLRDPRTIVH